MYIKVEGVTSSAFVRVDFYSPMCDHKSQELASANPKSTFFRVEAHVIFTELFEDLFLASVAEKRGGLVRRGNKFPFGNDGASGLDVLVH